MAEHGDGEPSVKRPRKQGSRYKKLQDLFAAASHSLLTACSYREFCSHFSFLAPEMQSMIYEFYAEVVAAVHQTCQDEFQSICTETKVQAFLADIERRTARANESDLAVPKEEKPPSSYVAKSVSDAKKSEIEKLRQILVQEEHKKSELSSRIIAMRNEIERMEDSRNSAVDKLKHVLATASDQLQ